MPDFKELKEYQSLLLLIEELLTRIKVLEVEFEKYRLTEKETFSADYFFFRWIVSNETSL